MTSVSACVWLFLILVCAVEGLIMKSSKGVQLVAEPFLSERSWSMLETLRKGKSKQISLVDPSKSSATSGEIFVMKKVRSYTGPRPDLDFDTKAGAPSYSQKVPCQSTKWAVSTSIFSPSKAIKQLAAKEGWCTVVVGDKKGPQRGQYGINSSRVIHISAEEQQKFMSSFETFKETPWRSFGRKNLGYLFAMSQGAETIYDFDDDNVLLPDMPKALSASQEASVRKVKTTEGHLFANVYALFEPKNVVAWPRGYDLHKIVPDQAEAAAKSDSAKVEFQDVKVKIQDVKVNTADIGVEQMLAQYNPDVDAIYRLTKKLPLIFEENKAVLLEPGTYSPFNAQATIWHRPAFFAMLLPTTVNGRVSDILRSYISQPLLWARKLQLAFVAPQVEVTNRNPHDLIGDLNGEWPLYSKLPVMVADMEERFRSKKTVDLEGPDSLFSLYVYLFEHGLVEEPDVRLALAWTRDVLRLQRKSSGARDVSHGSHTARGDAANTIGSKRSMAMFDTASSYFSGYLASDAMENAGTDRLGNFLNDWFLVGTCKEVPPRSYCPGECHGRPGSRDIAPVGVGFHVQPGCFGSWLTSNFAPVFPEVESLCGGEWWWAYYWKNWVTVGEDFRTALRPKALEFARTRGMSPPDASTGQLVVHYRLGDKATGTITPEALLRGINLLYKTKALKDPESVIVLAGSFNFWLKDSDSYKAECVQKQASFMKLVRERFPGAHIKDQYADVDEDWFTMAFAPVLVTSHGSYAVSAAAVNIGFRASPSLQNLNFPKRNGTDVIPTSLDRDRWLTYPVFAADVIM
mmetsp:Transcript_74923/g.132516  ORF Transcript_74923/g.132516 Transcript_74923/m.132516 type:complete len:800 (+) Transcript_74923:79-2478(+)